MNQNCFNLPFTITAVAEAIACCIEDDDELALTGALFTQLGDTLATISLQRDFCRKKQDADG